MALVSLEEAKAYLRVDSSDEDAVVGILLTSAGKLCADVARLTEEQCSGVEQIFFALFLLKPSYFFQFALKYKKIFFAKEKCSHGQHEEKK